MAEERLIMVTLKKSVIGSKEAHRKTVKALGLRRMHSSVVHKETPQIRGMLDKVTHLVHVREISQAEIDEAEKAANQVKEPTIRLVKAAADKTPEELAAVPVTQAPAPVAEREPVVEAPEEDADADADADADDEEQSDAVGERDQHLHPVEAVGALGVGRPARQAKGEPGEPEGGGVGEHVRGVGEQGERAREQAARDLGQHEAAGQKCRPERPPLVGVMGVVMVVPGHGPEKP